MSDRTGRAALPDGRHQEVIEAPASKSIPLASRGIRSTTDVKRVAFALAEDILNGAVAPKLSSAAVGAMSLGLRAFRLEQRHAESLKPNGGGIDLLSSPVVGADPVADERAKLLSRLAELDAASGAVVKSDGAPNSAARG